jgi:hypothetical protein
MKALEVYPNFLGPSHIKRGLEQVKKLAWADWIRRLWILQRTKWSGIAQLGPRCLLYPFAFVWIIKSRESRLDFGEEEVQIPGIIDGLDESVVGGRVNRLS